jgi:hypothetical protein
MVRAFLAHGAATPVHLGRVLDAEPDAVLPLAAKGLFCLMLARRETVAAARASAEAARRALDPGRTPARAAAWLSALDSWLDGSPEGAVLHLEGVLARNPADTLTMKTVHADPLHAGRRDRPAALGRAGARGPRGRSSAAGLRARLPRLRARGNGRLRRGRGRGSRGARARARRRLGPARGRPCLRHDAPAREGIALLDRNEAAWSHCNNFRFHVWWHKALMHLDRGEHDRVLALYDTKIREERTDDFRDISNATSLLVRLELEGIDIGHRWGELADLAEARADDGCLVFADLHYMLALTGDTRPAAARRLVAQVARSGTR